MSICLYNIKYLLLTYFSFEIFLVLPPAVCLELELWDLNFHRGRQASCCMLLSIMILLPG